MMIKVELSGMCCKTLHQRVKKWVVEENDINSDGEGGKNE
jgi:hypothetical protein